VRPRLLCSESHAAGRRARAKNGFVRIEDVISPARTGFHRQLVAAAAGLDVETVNNGLSFVRPVTDGISIPRRLTWSVRVSFDGTRKPI